MRNRTVAVRYAQALLDVAIARENVDGVSESFDGLMDAVAGHDGLRVFLQSPQVPNQDKKALMRSVLGDRVESVLLDFFELLIDKDRIMHAADIHEEFASLVEDHRGLQRAVVVTAVALPTDLEEQLAGKLKALTGRSIIIEKKVDPSVIGGVCVTLGDKILDGTLRTGLADVRSSLEKAPLR